MHQPFATDLPLDGGINSWDQSIEFYISTLLPYVHSADIAHLIGQTVLDIQPYSSFVGWCFDGACVYGLEINTKVILSYGEYAGYTGTIVTLHDKEKLGMLDFTVKTGLFTSVVYTDISFFDFWETFGALVKFGCNDEAIWLDFEQFDHCFDIRHVM